MLCGNRSAFTVASINPQGVLAQELCAGQEVLSFAHNQAVRSARPGSQGFYYSNEFVEETRPKLHLEGAKIHHQALLGLCLLLDAPAVNSDTKTTYGLQSTSEQVK